MAQQDRLPEGTDQIIDGAAVTGTDIVEQEPALSPQTASQGEPQGQSQGGDGQGLKGQFRDKAQSFKQQAVDRALDYAEDGRGRATGALDSFAEAVNEAATTVEERFGKDYGDYARRAAGSVQGLSDTLREKDLEELYDEAVTLVRKSPAIAVGTAAVLGFALVRLARAGLSDEPTRSAQNNNSSSGTRDTDALSG